MKRKLIVTLVATALELIAAQSFAQVAGGCTPLGTATTASGATPVRAGPLNPVSGFPEYVTDTNNLSLQRCLDPLVCFFDPVVTTDPFSIQIGSGGEAFYYGADNVVTNAAGDRILTYTAAAETAFLQAGPNGEPIDGSQFPFLRLRFTLGVPLDGTYTIRHPYGTDVFTVQGATGTRDIFSTVDRGLTPNTTITGPVGPFMRSVAPPVRPAGTPQFIGDAGPTAGGDLATGSPCGWNFVEVSGVDTNGNAVDFGTGETIVQSQLFTVQGQIYDGRVQTALVPSRVSYSRPATGAGQIDAFASSSATAAVTVQDGPTIVAGSGRIATPVTLARTALSATQGIDATSVAITNPSALPAVISVTATDTAAVPATDATTLNVDLIDFVDIAQADYNPATGVLTVVASSGDARTPPTLTLRDFGAFTAGNPIKVVATTAPPGVVNVDSSAGGSSSAQVRVVAGGPPNAPTALAVTASTSLTVSLSWTDNATNESGFRIYSVTGTAPNLVRTQLQQVGANIRTATVTVPTAGTAYTFQVDAFNGAGAASSNTVTVTTPALPLAPTAVSSALAPSPTSRGINVSFTDNSTDETAFQIQRATVVGGVAGTFATVGTLNVAAPATTGAITFTDVSGPPAVSTSYAYRVVTVRGPDLSAPSANSVTLATPAAPTANAAPTFGTVAGNSVVVNWARRNTTETGYVVYRATVTGGVVGAFAAVSGATPLGLVTTFTDSTVAAGVTYQYRINAVGWANYTVGVNGAVSANVTTPQAVNLVAPTALSASIATRPVLGWTDGSTGETNYRVSRTPITVNATTGAISAGATTVVSSTIAPLATPASGGVMSFTETNGQGNNVTVRYDIQALSGATAGTASSVYAITTALPTVATPTTAAIAGGGIRVNWTASTTTTVGGYAIERCTGAGCTNFTALTTVNGRSSTNFADTTATTVGTTYRYRMRTVGGVGTNVTPGTFSGTVTRVR